MNLAIETDCALTEAEAIVSLFSVIEDALRYGQSGFKDYEGAFYVAFKFSNDHAEHMREIVDKAFEEVKSKGGEK